MAKKYCLAVLFSLISLPTTLYARTPHEGFVYLKDIDSSIYQDIRYAGYHNFMGRPVTGYQTHECILTKKAALALAKVQSDLKKSHLSLKVYDCYRPQRAVNDFVAWSKNSHEKEMKAEFYPKIAKNQLFPQGYIAEQSGHTRGSTMDLTIVSVPTLQQKNYHQGQKLVACYAPYLKRFRDNSIDMGTGFDCMDSRSHGLNPRVSIVAYQHRQLLRHLMQKHGFVPYEKEWWHFTLKDEPYPKTYFNFPITADKL